MAGIGTCESKLEYEGFPKRVIKNSCDREKNFENTFSNISPYIKPTWVKGTRIGVLIRGGGISERKVQYTFIGGKQVLISDPISPNKRLTLQSDSSFIDVWDSTFINTQSSPFTYKTNCFSHAISHIIDIPKGYFLEPEGFTIFISKHFSPIESQSITNIRTGDVIVMTKEGKPIHAFRIIVRNGKIYANSDNGIQFEVITPLNNIMSMYEDRSDDFTIYRANKKEKER